ncbi:hypothetical protein B0H19DRAFT_1149941 [Mycena capillaripes]|nr:hypothetical protein B0H19DRAFT_1149941 [Mycena capillaripes]
MKTCHTAWTHHCGGAIIFLSFFCKSVSTNYIDSLTKKMALNFNTPSRIFRAFGGLFVLFGGGFYVARKIVSARRATDLEDYRTRQGQITRTDSDDRQ